MPDILRRRILTMLALAPFCHSVQAQPAPDLQRIIALEWMPAELLIALGVIPAGVAETRNYRRWVGQPELPASVADVGLRTEPNIELLIQMQPSLIVSSQGFGPSESKLKRIAPVITLEFNRGNGPLASARESVELLGTALGLEVRAQQHLQQLTVFLQQTRQQLAPFSSQSLLLMSLLDTRHAMVVGKNSLFDDVMIQLGISNAWQGETSSWGSAVVGIERLAAIRDAHVLCFDHENDQMTKEVMATTLWQSFDFVRQQRFHRVPPAWLFGSTLSVVNFCHTLKKTLVQA